jgi:predicted transcriptional regulator
MGRSARNHQPNLVGRPFLLRRSHVSVAGWQTVERDEMTAFSKNLRAARERRDMSQTALANQSGIVPSAISHFESGRREPSAGSLRKLAVALDITADYLLGLTKETRRIER